jgi:hypothetical protein
MRETTGQHIELTQEVEEGLFIYSKWAKEKGLDMLFILRTNTLA